MHIKLTITHFIDFSLENVEKMKKKSHSTILPLTLLTLSMKSGGFFSYCVSHILCLVLKCKKVYITQLNFNTHRVSERERVEKKSREMQKPRHIAVL